MAGATYARKQHAATRTTDFVFSQLIPYIGNKRRLLDLIARALPPAPPAPAATFLDLFAGSGVVARFAKTRGYRVIANDWEPYARVLNGCAIAHNAPPAFAPLGGYAATIARLNALPPRADWVTNHLCPLDDGRIDPARDRLFFMRKNGMRIDAIRGQIQAWRDSGDLSGAEQDCLLSPLLYQACYTSNTSGVFKGFHNGWGGRTRTALYRIAGDLLLAPALFHDNGQPNENLCGDAQAVAGQLRDRELDVAYLDPPYNQHPYGSNYHVLNSLALWDKPALSPSITPRTKSAIRLDWRTQRRSAYNDARAAAGAYAHLLDTLNARFILTSYSTDGFIPLEKLLEANLRRGHTRLEMKGYKRYRVSSQRFSGKPMNVEFVVVLDTHRKADLSLDALRQSITALETTVLDSHRESGPNSLAFPE
jgi:adenine-specific DNA-methyltransferase